MTRNGFTLVELLVVIALMGVMAGAVVMTIGGGDGPSAAATRFASRLAAARDLAVVGGRPISPWVSASGYGFDQYGGGRWQLLTGKPLGATDWPDGVVAAADTGSDPNRTAGVARIRLDSIGLPDRPLTVRLAADGRRAEVQLAANGDVTVR